MVETRGEAGLLVPEQCCPFANYCPHLFLIFPRTNISFHYLLIKSQFFPFSYAPLVSPDPTLSPGLHCPFSRVLEAGIKSQSQETPDVESAL